MRRGRAVLSFTNVACAEIRQRCSERDQPDMLRFPHFVGTIDTFLWRYLLRPYIEPNRRRHRIVSWDRVNAVVTVPAQPYDHKIRLSDFQFRHDLVLQRQGVVLESLPLVVALSGSGLVDSSPVRPVVDVCLRVVRVGLLGPEPTDFVTGQRN